MKYKKLFYTTLITGGLIWLAIAVIKTTELMILIGGIK